MVDAPLVDGEGPLPDLPGISDEASAGGDPGVVEEEIHVFGVVRSQDLITEPQDLALIGDVAEVTGDPAAGPGVVLRQPYGLSNGRFVHVAPITEHPSLASWTTSSRPIPEPAPVTTASLPAKDFMLSNLWARSSNRQKPRS